MGMFDYFIILDPDVLAQVKCAHGHPATEHDVFQTKDYECLMDTLYLKDGKLHLVHYDWNNEQPQQMPPGNPVEFTGQLRFYTNCEHCEPTLWTSSKRPPSFKPNKEYPWMEYIALFRKGALLSVDPERLETQEEHSAIMSVHWTQITR
jgi:hypothetical protein